MKYLRHVSKPQQKKDSITAGPGVKHDNLKGIAQKEPSLWRKTKKKIQQNARARNHYWFLLSLFFLFFVNIKKINFIIPLSYTYYIIIVERNTKKHKFLFKLWFWLSLLQKVEKFSFLSLQVYYSCYLLLYLWKHELQS